MIHINLKNTLSGTPRRGPSKVSNIQYPQSLGELCLEEYSRMFSMFDYGIIRYEERPPTSGSVLLCDIHVELWQFNALRRTLYHKHRRGDQLNRLEDPKCQP